MFAIRYRMQKLINVSKWLTTLFIGLFFCSGAVASTDRTDLVKIAHEGLSYFLTSATFNKAFFNALTADQKNVMSELSQILEDSANLRFYESNNIQGFKMPDGRKNFAYVDQHETVKTFLSLNTKAPELLISNRRDEFKNLKPGEPERFLKTTPDFSSAIYVNALKLNEDPAMAFDLGRAVSILVHEYGHKVRQSLEKKLNRKLADTEIQPTVDKLGEDLGSYIRGKINKFPLKNGVIIYALGALDFDSQAWLEHGFIKAEGRVSLMANQGLYMWSDFQGEIRNISNSVRAQAIKNILPTSTLTDSYYQFVNLNLLLPASIKVLENSPGQVSIHLTAGQVAMQIPYMKPNISPDPKQASFNRRYRWNEAGHAIIPSTTIIDAQFNGPLMTLKSALINPRQISPLPAISAKIGTVQIEKNDLVFKVDVKDTEGTISFIGLTRGFISRACEIKIKNRNGQIFYLTSEFLDGSRAKTERIASFVFRLKEATDIVDQSFEIESVYIRSEPDLMSKNGEVRLEVPLFERLQIDMPQRPVKTAVMPKALEIASINTEKQLIKIRLNSDQSIQKVSLILGVQDITYALVRSAGQGQSMYYKFSENSTTDRLVEVSVNQNQFSTIKKDGYSEIQFQLSDIFRDSQYTVNDQNTNKHGLDQTMGTAQVLNPQMKIHEVSLLTTSLQTVVDTTEHTFTLLPEKSSKSKDSLDFIMRDFVSRPFKHSVIFIGRCSTLF